MQILENLLMLKDQFISIIYSPFNRILILCCSAQIASMIAKVIIRSIMKKNLSFDTMANYGGMPSSHTVFIASFVFGIAFDKNYGWQSPLFVLSLILCAIIITDTIRFRGTVDKLNDILKEVVEKNKELNKDIKFPRHIAHKPSEVIGGFIFSFFYTLIFYLVLYNIFPG